MRIIGFSISSFIEFCIIKVLQNIGVPATRLQSQTVCTPCLNLMIADISNLSKGVKTQ